MMNKQIRSMVDEIFADMKMTAENLALRDELMANAQARYEDSVAQGKSEEDAFREVAASLEDVCGLLEEMKRMDEASEASKAAAPDKEACEPVPELKLGTEDEEAADKDAKGEEAADGKQAEDAPQTDLGDALNKAFTALGDFGQAIMPEARKIYGQVDEATGGVLGKLGRAARRGMRDAQKVAEEAIDRLSGESGELVFDFGANKEAKGDPEEKQEADGVADPEVTPEATPEAEDAPQDDLEAAMEAARREAERAAREAEEAAADGKQAEDAPSEEAPSNEAPSEETSSEEAFGDGADEDCIIEEFGADEEPEEDAPFELDKDAFARSVEEMAREAEEVLHEAARAAEKAADYVVHGENEPVSGRQSFPAAGLHRIEIQLDADDVEIVPSDSEGVETLWEAKNADSEPVITLSGHTLSIRRKNPDVFKTFFSVFQQAGGRITVRVPRGYGISYAVTTTCGDVRIRDLDVDDVKVNTTSGDVRVEPDARIRAGEISVTTVSGHAAVSACAEMIGVTTVSGGQFISCDASKVDVNVVSGKVHVEGACDEWEISAVSSDVELLCTVAPTKKVQISSVHGDVRLALPDNIRGFVAQSNGALGCEIVNEFGPNRYGTCALPITMETLRGKLMITRL